MSQIFKAGVGGTPSVPTSFTTDFQDSTTTALTAPIGTVVPQANVLRVGGDNGIKTYEITQQAGALTVGFIRGAGSTVGATSATLITQATNTNATMTVQILVAGYETTTNVSIGAWATAVISNVAGVASIVEIVDFVRSAAPSISVPNPVPSIAVNVAGSNFTVDVTGVAGLTFNWEVCLPGIIST